MQHLHAFFRWLLALFRDLFGTVPMPDNVYSKEWQERSFPGDGL